MCSYSETLSLDYPKTFRDMRLRIVSQPFPKSILAVEFVTYSVFFPRTFEQAKQEAKKKRKDRTDSTKPLINGSESRCSESRYV